MAFGYLENRGASSAGNASQGFQGSSSMLAMLARESLYPSTNANRNFGGGGGADVLRFPKPFRPTMPTRPVPPLREGDIPDGERDAREDELAPEDEEHLRMFPTAEPQPGGIDWTGWTLVPCGSYPLLTSAGQTGERWIHNQALCSSFTGPHVLPMAETTLAALPWPLSVVYHNQGKQPNAFWVSQNWYAWEEDFRYTSDDGQLRPMPGTASPTKWKYGVIEINEEDHATPDADGRRRDRRDADIANDGSPPLELPFMPGGADASYRPWYSYFPGSYRFGSPAPGRAPQVVPWKNPEGVPISDPVIIPREQPAIDPAVSPVRVPGLGLVLRPGPLHRRLVADLPRRPGRRTREVKAGSSVGWLVWKIANILTEGCDAVEALWDALPKSAQTRTAEMNAQRRAVRASGGWNPVYRKVKPSCGQQLNDVGQHLYGLAGDSSYAGWDEVVRYMDKSIQNLVTNHYEDKFFGAAGKAAGSASRASGRPVGFTAGPAL